MTFRKIAGILNYISIQDHLEVVLQLGELVLTLNNQLPT